MKKNESDFLRQLERVGHEQAQISASSPLPEWAKPAARILGEKPFQTLFLSSFAVSIIVSVLLFPFVLTLFERGVLAWMLN